MVIVNILGGLGNQMFQYAFGYAVSKKIHQKFKLDIDGFDAYDLRNYELGLFNVNEDFSTKEEVDKLRLKKSNIFIRVLYRLLKKPMPLSKQYYSENGFYFDKNVFKIKGDTYFNGYWQSEKYFKEYRSELLKQFTLKNGIHFKTKEYQQKINSSNSVSLHIRRGDYITNATTNSVHGTCDINYYKMQYQKYQNR